MRALLAMLMLVVSSGCFAITVHISGSTVYQGAVELPEKARINQLLEKVQTDENSFFLGARWLRESEKIHQAALKKGLLFDLTLIANSAALHNEKEAAQLTGNFAQLIEKLPVTGRIPHVLDPAAVLGTRINHRLEHNDHINFPAMPARILLTGAVANSCALNYMPLQTAAYYLQQCKPKPLADKNRVFIIQADGNITAQGIAPWNRKKQSFIAPGAIIFIPFKTQLSTDINELLNEQIAEFLATQTPMDNLP